MIDFFQCQVLSFIVVRQAISALQILACTELDFHIKQLTIVDYSSFMHLIMTPILMSVIIGRLIKEKNPHILLKYDLIQILVSEFVKLF